MKPGTEISGIKAVELPLLAPITRATFMADYWEKQPLLVSRSEPEYFQSLLSVASIEDALSAMPLYYPDVQLTQSGETISSTDYADEQQRILPRRLVQYHQQGATIILSRAQAIFSPLSELCTEVSAALNARCATNVYLSAPGKQGFNAHYDTHDVFILQVSGSKTFHFYPSSTQLPLTDERFVPDRIKSAPVDDAVTLQAGDTLYIPRGVVHDAIADQSTASLHITLGIYPLLMKELMQNMIQIAAADQLALRRSVLDKSIDETALLSLMTKAMDASTLKAAISQYQDELALDLPQSVQGTLSQSERVSNARDPLSSVSLKPAAVLNTEQLDDSIKVRMPGQIVSYEGIYRHAVSILLNKGTLSREDVSDMSDEQYAEIVTRFGEDCLIESF